MHEDAASKLLAWNFSLRARRRRYRRARSRRSCAAGTCVSRETTDAGPRPAASTRPWGRTARAHSRAGSPGDGRTTDGVGTRRGWRAPRRRRAGRRRADVDVEPASGSPTAWRRTTRRPTWSSPRPVAVHRRRPPTDLNENTCSMPTTISQSISLCNQLSTKHI